MRRSPTAPRPWRACARWRRRRARCGRCPSARSTTHPPPGRRCTTSSGGSSRAAGSACRPTAPSGCWRRAGSGRRRSSSAPRCWTCASAGSRPPTSPCSCARASRRRCWPRCWRATGCPWSATSAWRWRARGWAPGSSPSAAPPSPAARPRTCSPGCGRRGSSTRPRPRTAWRRSCAGASCAASARRCASGARTHPHWTPRAPPPQRAPRPSSTCSRPSCRRSGPPRGGAAAPCSTRTATRTRGSRRRCARRVPSCGPWPRPSRCSWAARPRSWRPWARSRSARAARPAPASCWPIR